MRAGLKKRGLMNGYLTVDGSDRQYGAGCRICRRHPHADAGRGKKSAIAINKRNDQKIAKKLFAERVLRD
jgi:hypothetical protein